MKTLQKTAPRWKLVLERLVVDTFPTSETEIPTFAAVSISVCTLCPSRVDSTCPCCTSPEQCG